MKHKYAIFVRFINILFDFFTINFIAFFLVLLTQPFYYVLSNLLWLNVMWGVSTFFAKLYLYRNLIYFRHGFRATVKALLYLIIFNITCEYFLINPFFATKQVFIKFLLTFSLIFILSRLVFYLLKKYFSLEFFWSSNVITIGDLEIATLIIKQFLEKKELGYQHIHHLTDKEVNLNSPEYLIDFIKSKQIHEVFFVNTLLARNDLYNFIKLLEENSIRVKFVPDFRSFYTKPNNLVVIGDYPVLFLRKEPLESLFNRMIKRLFDIFFSIIVIVMIFSWLFPIIAIIIKVESRGPIFFKQKRTGRNNKPFWCFKFRSMRLNEVSDYKAATRGDSRITRIGLILRKTSIDELPQFFNVLLGNMSIVGPRPHMIVHTTQYASLVDKYMVRNFVKPGITGWAQVNGYRGEIEKLSDIEGRVEKDIWYIENWSFALDLQIVLLTIYNIFKGEEKAY